MKKGIALVLSIVMMLSLMPVSAMGEFDWLWPFNEKNQEDAIPESASVSEAQAEESTPEPEILAELPEELIVGHTTETKGDFFTEMFGNNTSDIDVRALLHGYNLVDWDQVQGVYIIDDYVVKKNTVTQDAMGNKTYHMTIRDDLYYSDGSHITSWDYAFSFLLMMAPEIEEIGGKIYRAEHILGYEDYILKRTHYLQGVRVKGDFQLEITLDHEFLPYFFEIGLLLCVPYPIDVIAPGCRVYDDGFGIYIGNANRTSREIVFTADLLRKTILDPETGYNTHPSVVSGPYVMKSYDGVTGCFEENPYYKRRPGAGGEIVGEDAVPIDKVRFTLTNNNTMVQELKDGELHLVDKVTYGPVIEELIQNAGEANLNYQTEPRIGLSFLTFTYDWPTVHEKEVRQAIAWCMDRDQLTQDYCKGYGYRVDGYYGVGQWEYMLINGKLDYPIQLVKNGTAGQNIIGFPNRVAYSDWEYKKMKSAWESLSLHLTPYKVDIEKANQLLMQAGWTFNRQSGWFNPEVDDVRCKWINGELVPLDLTMMFPEGNHIVDTLQENFIDNLNKCGIKLTLVPTPMDELFYYYYRESERTTDMIYLATNFHVIVDPSITYSSEAEDAHKIWNNTYSDDPELWRRAVEMRKTEPGDVFTYVQKWIRFQERYNEILPAIPIYSNIYFDFFTNQLQNYDITAHVTWSQAILESYFSLAEQKEEEEFIPEELRMNAENERKDDAAVIPEG